MKEILMSIYLFFNVIYYINSLIDNINNILSKNQYGF